jgi:hypothetical protein
VLTMRRDRVGEFARYRRAMARVVTGPLNIPARIWIASQTTATTPERRLIRVPVPSIQAGERSRDNVQR